MGLLSRRQLFLVFLLLTLIDATTLAREARPVAWSVGAGVAGLAVLLDVWLLWRLAWLTPAEMPDPSFAAGDADQPAGHARVAVVLVGRESGVVQQPDREKKRGEGVEDDGDTGVGHEGGSGQREADPARAEREGREGGAGVEDGRPHLPEGHKMSVPRGPGHGRADGARGPHGVRDHAHAPQEPVGAVRRPPGERRDVPEPGGGLLRQGQRGGDGAPPVGAPPEGAQVARDGPAQQAAVDGDRGRRADAEPKPAADRRGRSHVARDPHGAVLRRGVGGGPLRRLGRRPPAGREVPRARGDRHRQGGLARQDVAAAGTEEVGFVR
ncbi:hypothetical protein WJX74_004560 [Apatococcus lobatus]|uniref:Secreted protein n=1 Tax=Apatococcus lobatus TaxID=904363 RepID=A0AAW1Q298_9CHLO